MHKKYIKSRLNKGEATIQKKYLKISWTFLTLVTSQVMSSYRETNIAKKK